MTDTDTEQKLYPWELNLALEISKPIFSVVLQRIFVYQPVNPQQYCFHLLSAWDGESV